MVDEAAYRNTREQVVNLPCVFQGALLARATVCELAAKQSLAEREVLSCKQPTAHINCETLSGLFHERATFPLHLHPSAPITHAMEMRLQCGGLQGLQKVLTAAKTDVHQLVCQAQAEQGSLTGLPWAQIVESIVSWQPRKRNAPKKP